MPSLIPGYEYDIFVSYRHHDNLPGRQPGHPGWVTEFVETLKGELSSTIKDPVSVYFDFNAHDGLLESHHVDKSLEGKLNCLIFVPIISQTYCHPKSFAWTHEFQAFRNLASGDKLGLHLKLPNGNISSRILPICIHDLDEHDQYFFENESGDHLRSIDFIFKSPGVNRPLLLNEDHPQDNTNKTFYRDQINKVANTIKDVIHAAKDHQYLNPKAALPEARQRRPLSLTDKIAENSIAVIPFVNMSNDPEQEYFSEGISEEIINAIVQLPSLKVAGRTSSFIFKGKNEDLRKIGQVLGVSKILEGSVRKFGSKVRITAQLIEASTGFHLWSSRYDRELDDIFAIQDEIALEIARQLKITFTKNGSGQKARKQTDNIDAYQLYYKGRSYFYQRGAAMQEAINCFQKALELDPHYGLASAGLADAYCMMAYHGLMPPGESWPKAIFAVHNAIKNGPHLAETHNALAVISLLHDRNWDFAEKEFKEAIAINPSYTQARVWYGWFYLMLIKKKYGEAIEQTRMATENDPLSSYAHSVHALCLATANIFKEAIDVAEYGLQLDPASYRSHWALACCHRWLGNYEAAIKEYQISLEISDRHAWSLSGLLPAYLDSQKIKEATLLFDEMDKRYRETYFLPSALATCAAALGKHEYANKIIRNASDITDPYLITLLIGYKDGEPLRKLPEFGQTLERLGLHEV